MPANKISHNNGMAQLPLAISGKPFTTMNFPGISPGKIQSKITCKKDFAEHETGQDNRQVIVLFIKTFYNGSESEEIAWNAMYRLLR